MRFVAIVMLFRGKRSNGARSVPTIYMIPTKPTLFFRLHLVYKVKANAG